MTLDALQPEEKRLLLALRSIPESPLRDRLQALLAELVRFVAEPCCAELQADGAPCSTAQAACDQCRKLSELLDGLRRRLQAG